MSLFVNMKKVTMKCKPTAALMYYVMYIGRPSLKSMVFW